jgi:hypothetical protein
MAILSKGTTYSDGDQVTSTNLNALVDSATFVSGAVDDSTTQLSSGAIIVKDLGIAAGKIATNAVTTVKILDSNVTKAKIENVANLKVLGNVSGSAAAPAEVAILDEDNMASNSATSLATQQSIKAYADSKVDGTGAGSFTTLAASGDVTFDTTTLKVDSSNNRVGIGEASPTKLLHVKSPNSDTAETVAVFGNGDISDGLEIKTNGNGGSSLDWGFNAKNTRNLVFDTNQTERMRIDSSGNVGVGTNNPSYLLDVSPTSNGGEIARFKSDTTNAAADVLIVDQDNSNTRAALQVQGNAGSTECLFVGSNGNVGIGTSSPAHKLDVNSGATNQVALFESTDETAYIELADSTGSAQLITLGSGDLRISTGGSGAGNLGTSGLYITQGQDVGIGDDSPSYKLDVNGTGRFVGQLTSDGVLEANDALEVNGYIRGPANNEGVLLLQAGASSSNSGTGANIELYPSNHATTSVRNNAYYDAGVHVFRPQDGSVANFLITAAGDVAIGPAAPAHALDVTGTGRFSTGVTFGSDTAAANKLDDYEEGTWLPAITFGGGNTGVSYNYQVGTFTKIGDLVTASCYMTLSSKGSSTGAAVLTGLPVASRNLTANLVPATLRLSNISFADFPMAWNQTSSTDIHLQETTNSGTTTNLTDANFSNSSEVMISISYRV